MNKKEILSEIQRIAKESNGKAPGFRRFSSETGLRRSEWYPHLWLRWGDAIIEADCNPNSFNEAYDKVFLIKKQIELIRELGRFPISGEIILKSKTDKSFPSQNTFSRLGSKHELIKMILDFCDDKNEFKDIVSICLNVKTAIREVSYQGSNGNKKIGFAYLMKHGKRNEYKIGKTFNPIRREGEIRLELPEKIDPIHYIKTDDPSGIEAYWHNRFSQKRKEGEWFQLNKEDINAFKKWKKLV